MRLVMLGYRDNPIELYWGRKIPFLGTDMPGRLIRVKNVWFEGEVVLLIVYIWM